MAARRKEPGCLRGLDLPAGSPAATLHPVHDYLFADAQNEVARRALVQMLAIRSWQLKHDGRFPENLEALVPGELPSLPLDPYSGQPFGYIRSGGAGLLPLDLALAGVQTTSESTLIKPPPGSWLLYSVGIDLAATAELQQIKRTTAASSRATTSSSRFPR